jgi:hypothetical protein
MVATRAPVAVVFRRGPSGYWHIGRWDLVSGEYEPGAWLRGMLYPRRCDLSPDGTLLLAFIMKRTGPGFLGPASEVSAYFTVSRLPWLFALAAWAESGTWTRGAHFVEGPSTQRPFLLGEPVTGDAAPLRRRYGIAATPNIQYAAERLRGWSEHEDSPPRETGGPWDEQRCAILQKARPGGPGRLVLTDQGMDVRAARVEGRAPTFTLERAGRLEALDDAAWADWDSQGRLLVATLDGRLEIRDPDHPRHAPVSSHALAALRPAPGPAPEWARHW